MESPDEHRSGPELRRRSSLPLWHRLGLRARITAVFGLGALLLSASLGGLSYFTTRHFLLDQRESAALHQAYVNAALIRTALHSGENEIEPLLVDADSGTAGSTSLLDVEGTWYARSISVNHGDLPESFRSLVVSGHAATQTILLGGSPEITVGVPIPAVHAEYFELFDVSDLSNTLGVLALALFLAGLVTTVLGAAVGRAASARSLKPLTDVSRVAVAIADGQLDARLEILPDDPDLAGLTASFNRMVGQLQERIQREIRFTSDVDHELRSPLTTLSASMGVLEAHRDEMPDPARRALVLVGADLRRFERLVTDLLEISRSDTGSADVSLDQVTAGELVRRALGASLATLDPDVASPNLWISPAAESTPLAVDKRRFERIMANLIENALFYGGGASEVRIERARDHTKLTPTIRVSVIDHGPGIPLDDREQVFERFYRGSRSGQRGARTGSGLGLALVAEHVRLQGGSVWVEESTGGGSTFVVELPVLVDGEW